MKAVRIHAHGGLDQLKYEETPEPQPGPTEVLVRVKACALNHLDLWVREGSRGQVPMPHILGCDVAGTVEQVGTAVEGVKVGEKVIVSPGIGCGHCQFCLWGQDSMCASYGILGQRYHGGYAELVKAPGVNIVPIPQGLTFEQAAAVPLVFLTAWHMLVGRADLRAGEDLLVHAAGSGVGSAAIQIGKLLGARVITTASTDEKLQKAKALGADDLINYSQTDFYDGVRKLVGRKGVEVVFEHVGGEVFEKSIRAMATNGRLVTCGATAGFTPPLDLRYVYSRHLQVIGCYMGSKAELLQVLRFFSTGQLKPVVHAVLPLTEAAQAHQLMLDRRNFGKIVLQVA